MLLLLLPNELLTKCNIEKQKNVKHIFEKNNSMKQPNKRMNTHCFTARFTGLWRSYKMPETISKSAYQRLRGAYMGYNSFGGAMEYWPEARWGNTTYFLSCYSFVEK